MRSYLHFSFCGFLLSSKKKRKKKKIKVWVGPKIWQASILHTFVKHAAWRDAWKAKPCKRRNHFLWQGRGVWTLSVRLCFFFQPPALAQITFSHLHSCKAKKRKKRRKKCRHPYRGTWLKTVWPTELRGGRIKGQQLCHRSSQLSGVCEGPRRAKSLGLNSSFLWQQEVGYGSVHLGRLCLIGWLLLGVNHNNAACGGGGGVVLMTVVRCSTCCDIWAQRETVGK